MEMFKYVVKETAFGILAALLAIGILISGAVVGDALIGIFFS